MKKVLLSLALISAFGLNNSWSQCTASLTVSTNINGEIVGVDNSFGAASISWSVFQQPWNYYFSDTTSGLSCYPPTSGTYYVCVTDWAVNQPGWCGPEVEVLDEGGKVRFLVHTPMGWERIYYLDITIAADGRVDQQAGQIVADLGQGEIF